MKKDIKLLIQVLLGISLMIYCATKKNIYGLIFAGFLVIILVLFAIYTSMPQTTKN